MKTALTWKVSGGRRFGAGRHFVKVGPLTGEVLCLAAGKSKVYTRPANAVAWLTRRGCPKGVAAGLVRAAAINVHQ